MTKDEVLECAKLIGLKVESIEPFVGVCSFSNNTFDDKTSNSVVYFGLVKMSLRGNSGAQSFTITAIRRLSSETNFSTVSCQYIFSNTGMEYAEFHGFFRSIVNSISLVAGQNLSFVGYKIKLNKTSVS